MGLGDDKKAERICETVNGWLCMAVVAAVRRLAGLHGMTLYILGFPVLGSLAAHQLFLVPLLPNTQAAPPPVPGAYASASASGPNALAALFKNVRADHT